MKKKKRSLEECRADGHHVLEADEQVTVNGRIVLNRYCFDCKARRDPEEVANLWVDSEGVNALEAMQA